MVSGLRLTSSDRAKLESGVSVPALFTIHGLGRTPLSMVWVPGASPSGVFGLHPVTLSLMPKEMAPPATPT